MAKVSKEGNPTGTLRASSLSCKDCAGSLSPLSRLTGYSTQQTRLRFFLYFLLGHQTYQFGRAVWLPL